MTHKAVDSINSGQEKTMSTSEEISEAGAVLQSIVKAVSKINNMNIQIATAAEEQAAVSDSISDNIHSISNLSQGAVARVDKNLQAAQQLQTMSEDLSQHISVFK